MVVLEGAFSYERGTPVQDRRLDRARFSRVRVSAYTVHLICTDRVNVHPRRSLEARYRRETGLESEGGSLPVVTHKDGSIASVRPLLLPRVRPSSLPIPVVERACLAQNLRHLVFTLLHGELERRLSFLRRRGGGQRRKIGRPDCVTAFTFPVQCTMVF